jgi:hypothetical protein
MAKPFKITGPLRHRGDVFRPGMEAGYLASFPTDAEVQVHRDQNRVTGDIPPQLSGGKAPPPEIPETADSLPRDFPGYRQLAAVGHLTRAAVKGLTEEQVRSTPGVGDARAEQILTARKTL